MFFCVMRSYLYLEKILVCKILCGTQGSSTCLYRDWLSTMSNWFDIDSTLVKCENEVENWQKLTFSDLLSKLWARIEFDSTSNWHRISTLFDIICANYTLSLYTQSHLINNVDLQCRLWCRNFDNRSDNVDFQLIFYIVVAFY